MFSLFWFLSICHFLFLFSDIILITSTFEDISYLCVCLSSTIGVFSHSPSCVRVSFSLLCPRARWVLYSLTLLLPSSSHPHPLAPLPLLFPSPYLFDEVFSCLFVDIDVNRVKLTQFYQDSTVIVARLPSITF